MTVEQLNDLCNGLLTNKDLSPEYDKSGMLVKTHCNQSARIMAQAFGCTDFNDPNLLADDMYSIMDKNASGLWSKVIGTVATNHAMSGGLAFASKTSKQLGEAHGHITVIAPKPMGMSGSLQTLVPFAANIGKNVQPLIQLVTAAFPVAEGEPAYFTWQ